MGDLGSVLLGVDMDIRWDLVVQAAIEEVEACPDTPRGEVRERLLNPTPQDTIRFRAALRRQGFHGTSLRSAMNMAFEFLVTSTNDDWADELLSQCQPKDPQ
jgi:hypothetical protein